MSLSRLVWTAYDVHRLVAGRASPLTLFYLGMAAWGAWRLLRRARRPPYRKRGPRP